MVTKGHGGFFIRGPSVSVSVGFSSSASECRGELPPICCGPRAWLLEVHRSSVEGGGPAAFSVSPPVVSGTLCPHFFPVSSQEPVQCNSFRHEVHRLPLDVGVRLPDARG